MSFFKNCNLIFPYVFGIELYYSLIIFKEIFTKLLVISEGIHLEISNFLRFSLTSIGISWWRNFFDQLYCLATIGCQSVVSGAKNEAISSILPLLTTLWQPIVAKWYNWSKKFLHQLMPIDVKENLKKLEISRCIPLEMTSNLVKISLKIIKL